MRSGRAGTPLLLQMREQLVARAPDYRIAYLKERLGGARIHLLQPEIRALLARPLSVLGHSRGGDDCHRDHEHRC